MNWTIDKSIIANFSFTEEECESIRKTADILYHITALLGDYDTIKVKNTFFNTVDIASLEDVCKFIRALVDNPICDVS